MALVVKNLPMNAGDARHEDLIPGSGRAPEEGNGTPLQYSCLEDAMDRGAWRDTVPGAAQSDTTGQPSVHTVGPTASPDWKLLSSSMWPHPNFHQVWVRTSVGCGTQSPADIPLDALLGLRAQFQWMLGTRTWAPQDTGSCLCCLFLCSSCLEPWMTHRRPQ